MAADQIANALSQLVDHASYRGKMSQHPLPDYESQQILARALDAQVQLDITQVYAAVEAALFDELNYETVMELIRGPDAEGFLVCQACGEPYGLDVEVRKTGMCKQCVEDASVGNPPAGEEPHGGAGANHVDGGGAPPQGTVAQSARPNANRPFRRGKKRR